MHIDQTLQAGNEVSLAKNKKVNWPMVYSWVVCGIGAIFYFYEYLLRVSTSVMTTGLMTSFHINAGALGNLSAYYYYVYTPMQLFVGVFVDRYGPRRLLTMAAFSCSIGSYMFASADNIIIAEIGRFLVGFGSAFAFVGVLKLATIWLPDRFFGMVSGMTMALGMIGGLSGDLLLTRLVDVDGWRLTSYMAAAVGLAITLVMFLLLRDKPKQELDQPISELPSLKNTCIEIIKIIRNPQIWIAGAIGCLVYIPTSAFAELWGPTYFKQAYHLTSDKAAAVVSMIFLGWAIGGPIVGWISDRIKQRRLPMTVGSVVAAVLISIVLYVPNVSLPLVYFIFFIFGMFSSAQVLVFAVGREVSPTSFAGTAISLTNMFVMLGGVVFQPLIGDLLDWRWSGIVSDGVHFFSTSDFQVALSVLPIGLLIAVFLTFCLQETHCKLVPENFTRINKEK